MHGRPIRVPIRCLHSIVNALAATIIALIDSRALAVQASVNLIALPVQAIRKALPARCVRSVRLAVETIVNAITLLVETIFDAISTTVEAMFDTVTRVCPNWTTNKEQDHADYKCFSDIHNESPLYPYKILSSVGTTQPPEGR